MINSGKLLSNVVALLIICVFSFSNTINLHAEDEVNIILEEVVVTATRDTQEIRKIPAHITVITAEDIEKSSATTVVGILNSLSGIYITTYSGIEAQASIDLRGFGENGFGRVLVMLDGRRLNRPDMAGVNWLQVPLNSIERIEVVRGANSTLYGDNAVAGVINIITKKGVAEPQVALSASAGSYGFNDQRLDVSLARNKYNYSFNFERMAEDGYRERSRFLSQGANLNLGYKFSEYVKGDINTSFSQIDYQLPGAITKSQINQNRRQPGNNDDDGKEKYQNLNPGIEIILGKFGRVSMNIFYGTRDIESNMASAASYSTTPYTDWTIDTFGITPRYILEKNILGKDNKLIVGLDYYDEDLNVGRFSDRNRATKIAAAELEKQSLGYYASDELNLFKQLVLSTGIRYEKATMKAREKDIPSGTANYDDKKEHNGNAFSIGVSYLIGKQSKAFARYATLYRYPFTNEQAFYQGWGSSFNKNLEAEKGKSYEVGTELHITQSLGSGITFYQIDMEDEIFQTYDEAYQPQMENLHKTRHQGIEFSSSYNAGRLVALSLNYTYLNSAFTSGDDDGKRIPLVPDQKVSLSAEFLLPNKISLTTRGIYTGQSYMGGDNSNNEEKLSDYTVVDLYLHWRPKTRYRFKAFAGIENLFNEKYSTTGFYGYFYPAPERSFSAGLSFEL